MLFVALNNNMKIRWKISVYDISWPSDLAAVWPHASQFTRA